MTHPYLHPINSYKQSCEFQFWVLISRDIPQIYPNNPYHKHPPIFVLLSVGKSFGVTPKSVGSHRFLQTKLTEILKKNRW